MIMTRRLTQTHKRHCTAQPHTERYTQKPIKGEMERLIRVDAKETHTLVIPPPPLVSKKGGGGNDLSVCMLVSFYFLLSKL